MYKTVVVIGLCISLFQWKMLMAQTSEPENEKNLSSTITFFAPFDDGFEAAIADGDPAFYTAPNWEERQHPQKISGNETNVRIHENEGRFGDALWIDNASEPVYFYKGVQNIPYSETDWEGTVTFWLRVSPNEELTEGYSDPIQLTDSAWNDGALYVDFTTKSPRTFRFAFFAERQIWDPQRRNWEDVPVSERPMIEVSEQIFSRDHWVHIAFSYRNFNTGEKNGVIDCYINGEKYDTLRGREQTLIWDMESVAIWFGYNYTGYLDDFAIFNRSLGEDSIRDIYSLSGGVGELISNKK